MIDHVLGIVLKILGTVLVIVVLLQITARYLPISASWTDEVARLLFVWFALLSMALTYAKNQHLFIDYIYLKLGIKTRAVLDLISISLVLISSAILTVTGWKVLKIVGVQKSSVLQISMKYFYLAVPVAFGIVVLFDSCVLIQKYLEYKKEKQEGVTEL